MTKWQKVKLGDVCRLYQPKTISTKELNPNGKYAVYGANGIIGYYDKYNHDEVELTITCRGATCGNVNMTQPKSWITGNAMVVHPIQDINLFFLQYCLKHADMSLVITGAAQPQITRVNLQKLNIPLPPKEEQERIAKKLDAVSDLLAKQKQLLTEQDTLIKSVFYDMFGDPVTNDKGWKIEKLEKFVDVIGGYAFKSGLFKKTGIPVLRIGNINTGVLKVDNLTFWDNDKSLSKYVVYPKDLVISLTGTVGKDDYANVCILSGEYNKYYLNQRNAHIVIKTSIDNVYLFCLLRNKEVKSRLTGISRGVRQANISNKDILNLLIPVPPLPLQQKFAAVVEQIEAQKQKIKSAIAETETLFNALMAKYFDEE